MEHFETRSIVTLDTFHGELKKHIKPPREKIRIAIGSALLMCLGILGISLRHPDDVHIFYVSIFCFIIAVLFPLIYIRQFNHVTKTNFRREQEQTGTAENERIVSFTDEKIKVHSVNTGATVFMDYNVVARCAETENIFVLFTKENLVIIVNKNSLVCEGKYEDFLRFIKGKCKNVKWRK